MHAMAPAKRQRAEPACWRRSARHHWSPCTHDARVYAVVERVMDAPHNALPISRLCLRVYLLTTRGLAHGEVKEILPAFGVGYGIFGEGSHARP
jgi:hypothetical protein